MFTCVRSLTGHTQSVTCIRWGGKDLIYSSSQDRTIKVWRSEDVKFNYVLLDNVHVFIELFILGYTVSQFTRTWSLGKYVGIKQ